MTNNSLQSSSKVNQKSSKNFLVLGLLSFSVILTIISAIAFSNTQNQSVSQAASVRTVRTQPAIERPTRVVQPRSTQNQSTTNFDPNNNVTRCVVVGNNQTCINGVITQR
jgi:hypothetical protein